MARKKSAAKRAKEEAEKKTLESNENKEVQSSSKDENRVQIVDNLESEDESSSEEEDEYGELITEDVEQGINKVLEAIRSDPKRLLDEKVKFFDENIEQNGTTEKKEKPMYLKDYHRMNLLSGGYKDADEDENEYGTVDGEKPFVVAEREERNQLLSDIKNAVEDGSDDDDDDFLVKKGNKEDDEEDIHVTKLPDASNQEEFLKSFFDQQAWIPRKKDKVINLDKIDQQDEEEFDEAVEKVEHAYNFRYEEENSAEILSYARSQATLRRSKTNSRKRQREKRQEERAQEEAEKQEELKKRKIAKANKVMDRLAQIKEAVGEEVSDEVIEKVFGDSLLKDDFDDAEWDNKMAEIFNEQYYGSELKKPEWDEDDEIMAEYHENEEEKEEEEEEEDESPESKVSEKDDEPSKKHKKDKKSDKKKAKQEKKTLKEKALSIVESNATQILDEIEEERGRLKNDEVKFKYREVSPETFGLTTRDILVADDSQLNNYIGLKKFAPYRPKELRMKDKRKYTKKKQLQQWRKEVLRGKHDIKGDESEIWIPREDKPKSKKRK
ncbi:hypothetical protein QFC19_009318 [Naganishia cerealis]|uniref:Uncharacterized protein n=1 Tax=Naganishia cerealis TaxID=610337 RepID=A0ACC2UW13_9TREE|nr:hypothetical protein QFC19_009318 [Naganishia cerealis]